MMAQSRAESTRDTYNYGQYINQFPPNTIKVIREFERIQKKICDIKCLLCLMKFAYRDNDNYDQKNKNRKRKIIWFNRPFCKLANIDVGKYFLRLIDKHFKQDNILHKIFNRKTLKISYSCTKNISQIINSHNNELINKFHNRVNNNNINSKKNRM